MKVINKLLVCTSFICTLLYTSSCISDDRSNCIEDDYNQLHIVMTYAPSCYSATDYLDETIDRIDLFAFDENGIYVEKWTLSPSFDNEAYRFDLSIEPGDYKFVAWGNLRDCYYMNQVEFIEGETSMNDLIIHLDRDENNQIDTESHILYYSSSELIHIDRTTGEKSIYLNLNENIHRINVVIESYYTFTDPISLIISDTESGFNFENEPVYFSDRIYYNQVFNFLTSNRATASITTIRLDPERETHLTLYNEATDEILYETDLLELIQILRNNGINLDLENDCSFEFTFRFDANMQVSVYINGWIVIEDGEEIYL